MTTNIKKYDFRGGLPQEFEIVDIAELYANFKDTLTTSHRAEFYHIIWFQEGNPIHLVDFNPIQIQPNTLLFLNKDTVQRFDNQALFQGKAILFTDRFFCKTDADTKFLRNTILFNDLFSVSQIQVGGESEWSLSKLLATVLQQMTDELQNANDSLQADILHNLLHNFLLISERERRKQGFVEIKRSVELDYVLVFKDFLEKSYKTQKQVSYYAQQIFVTEKKINQATTKILGKTPKEIIDDRILLEAKRILAHTSESVKEIAFYLGFEEPTNFIKYFKKHTSQTPIEFREKYMMA
jgi:AraC-like DNA-binding protein